MTAELWLERAIRMAASDASSGGSRAKELAGLPGSEGSYARGISGDGSIIVGSSRFRDGGEFFSRAFIWTEAGGARDLGLLPGTENAHAQAISRDGSTVVGSCAMPGGSLSPFRWTAAEGMQELEVFPGSFNAGARGVNADGAVMVGFCDVPGVGRRAVRWTVGQGIEDLGVPPGTDDATAGAISDDGKVILGLLHRSGGPPAGLWTDALGAVNFRSYLVSAGVSMSEWRSLGSAVPSADGSVIAGPGRLSGAGQRAYLVTGLDLPTCRLDLDADGELTFFDFLAFQDLFAAGEPRADFDGDGELTFFDFLAFQTAFAEGCP